MSYNCSLETRGPRPTAVIDGVEYAVQQVDLRSIGCPDEIARMIETHNAEKRSGRSETDYLRAKLREATSV